MRNSDELKRLFREAVDFLNRAEHLYKDRDWKGSIQNSQLCIEIMTKCIISFFSEPEWTHKPGEQLNKILAENEEELKEKLTEELYFEIKEIADYSIETASWHGKSVYGERTAEAWLDPLTLCTEEIATDLVEKARKSFNSTKKFIEKLKIEMGQ